MPSLSVCTNTVKRSLIERDRTHPTRHDHLVGRYAIANSAGAIDPERRNYATYLKATTEARRESRAGWLGECWPILLTARRP